MRPLFSVCVVARNEGHTLPGLLASLGGFLKAGGNMVLLDTGSHDDTVTIARDAGAVVVRAPQSDIRVDQSLADAINAEFVAPGEDDIIRGGAVLFDYGAARRCVECAAINDMICTPDADERFVRLDIGAIDDAILQGFSRFEVDFQDRPDNRFWYDARWYDRRFYRWVGTMHEHLVARDVIFSNRVTRIPTEACFMVHDQVPSQNRSNYLANLAYSFYMDQTNERQAHCLGRQLMYEKRYKSAIAMLARHFMMGGNDAYRPV